MPKETRLITVALPYTNNVPHIGNIVGSHLPGDIFTRYCKLQGHNTLLIGGTDEHGTPITAEAQKYNVSPRELCDEFYKIHKEIYDWFNIDYDNFSRTSREIHHKTVQEFYRILYKKRFLSEKTVKIPFCKTCNQSLPDRFIVGICPHCDYENAKGDQCERCGNLLEPTDLKNQHCSICNSSTIEFQTKKHLFFDLDKLSTKLKKWIDENQTWRKNVKSIALSWIKEGLKPRDITREIKWGVKLPFKGYETSSIYVWAEAAIGYISSTKEWNEIRWKKYWQKDSKIYNFIGKDNIPFHTLLFPAQLMAHENFTLPYNVVGLQYLNYERSKFSKSKRHGVFCENLPNADLDPDYWRFYLSFIIPENKDTEFLWQDFQDRINSDLIGNLGNFFNRTLTFICKNANGKIPLSKEKDKTQEEIEKKIDEVLDLFEKVELRQALEKILEISDLGNKYFQEKEPWKKNDPYVLYLCGNLCKILALLVQPFLPSTSKKILETLNCKETNYEHLKSFNLKNHIIKKPKILFKKLESKKIEEIKKQVSIIRPFFNQKKLKEEMQTQNKMKFTDIDLRVGRIKAIKDHPNADKLYIILLDLGNYNADKTLQIVSGLKLAYKKEELLNKKIIVITNLENSIIRGVESSGMLLAVEDDSGKLALLISQKSIPGSKVYTDEPDTKSAEEIKFNDFKSFRIKTKNSKVYYDEVPLKTDKEEVSLDKEMADGLIIE